METWVWIVLGLGIYSIAGLVWTTITIKRYTRNKTKRKE